MVSYIINGLFNVQVLVILLNEKNIISVLLYSDNVELLVLDVGAKRRQSSFCRNSRYSKSDEFAINKQ